MKTLIAIILLLTVVDSFACSCTRVGILKNKKEVDYVFKGRVTEIIESVRKDTVTGTSRSIEYRLIQYRFEIVKSYKGLKNMDTITLLQGMTDCAVTFDKNKTYIVYARTDNRKLHYNLANQETEPYSTTHLCSRTKKRNVLTFWETFVLWLM